MLLDLVHLNETKLLHPMISDEDVVDFQACYLFSFSLTAEYTNSYAPITKRSEHFANTDGYSSQDLVKPKQEQK